MGRFAAGRGWGGKDQRKGRREEKRAGSEGGMAPWLLGG